MSAEAIFTALQARGSRAPGARNAQRRERPKYQGWDYAEEEADKSRDNKDDGQNSENDVHGPSG